MHVQVLYNLEKNYSKKTDVIGFPAQFVLSDKCN